MAKRPTIINISSGYTSTTALNDNFEAIQQAFDNTLSRDGSLPNALNGDLDLNGNDITNVNTLTDASGNDFIAEARGLKDQAAASATAAATSATAAETAKTATETAYNNVEPYLDEIEVVGDDLASGSFIAGTEYDFGSITDTTTGTSGSPDGFIVTVYNNLGDIGTVAGNDANITTVAGISAEVTSVAGNEANIATVGTISADITSVAGISANVTSVAGNATNINAVAADSTDIGTVSANIASVNTVATNINDVITVANDLNEAISEIETAANDLNEVTSEIDTVANSIANVDTVGTNIANVNTVAGVSTDVTTVAGISAATSTVSSISGNVTSVANNQTNINTVAGDTTAINTVAGDTTAINTAATDSAVINTVSGISADVTATAGKATEIGRLGTAAAVADLAILGTTDAVADMNTLAAIDTAIQTVSGVSSNVSTVAGIASSVSTLALINSDVTTVSGISANVTTVAGIASDVTAVAADVSDIGVVATNIANVNNVGGSISSVNTVASNLTSVNSFAEQYRVGATEPTTSLDTGDLFYDTTSGTLKVYNGTGWEQGVTAGSGFLPLSGGTLTGALSLPADPTNPLQVATKQYVDTIAAAGIHYHTPVRVESPTALNATYNNGTDGVGATLTNAGTQAALVIDGITLNSADRVLVYNQSNAAHNGVYTVTNVGSGSTNWVLTRATDADSYGASDPNAMGEGDAYFVKEGATGAGELYVMNTSGTITFGTTAITFTVIAETAVYDAGDSLTLTGTTFDTVQDIRTTASPTFNSITVTGTVDGRDVASDGTKLDGIEAGADVTDAANVEPLVDAHINVSGASSGQYLGWNGSDYAWSTVDLSTKLNLSGGTMTGAINFVAGQTFDGRDVSADGAKLDGIEANAKDDQTITAGSGLTGGGTGNVTLNHADTSSQASVNNSGATVIQDVTVDTYGHVTGLGSKTMTLADLGYTGATNANYITNNNQLTNGAGYHANSLSNDMTCNKGYSDDWWRSYGSTGWYSQDYGGGIYMTDSSWVRVYNNKGVLTTGTMQAGNFNTTSDIKLKENVVTLENSLDKIKAMRGVSFDWKDSGKSTIGLIAQEVEQVLPELVEHNKEDDVKTVSYANIVAVLIEAIKEQQGQIDALKEKLGE